MTAAADIFTPASAIVASRTGAIVACRRRRRRVSLFAIADAALTAVGVSVACGVIIFGLFW